MNTEQLKREIRKIRAKLTLAFRRARAEIRRRLPGAKRLWKQYGYYAATAALVVMVGLGAHFWQAGDGEEPAPEAAVPVSVAVLPEATPSAPAFALPLSGRIAGTYSEDVPVWNDALSAWQVHTGVDIEAGEDGSVTAMAKGTVSEVYEDSLMGWVVEIEHDGGCMTRYASLDSVRVTPGDSVRQGTVIGAAGDSAVGEPGLGAHLHLEAFRDGVRMDPMELIRAE